MSFRVERMAGKRRRARPMGERARGVVVCRIEHLISFDLVRGDGSGHDTEIVGLAGYNRNLKRTCQRGAAIGRRENRLDLHWRTIGRRPDCTHARGRPLGWRNRDLALVR